MRKEGKGTKIQGLERHPERTDGVFALPANWFPGGNAVYNRATLGRLRSPLRISSHLTSELPKRFDPLVLVCCVQLRQVKHNRVHKSRVLPSLESLKGCPILNSAKSVAIVECT